MSNAITPSEQELAAYDEVYEAIHNPTEETISGERYRRAAIIATHTRYEGKTADQIATMWVRELARAEAAEAQARLGWERAAEKDTAYQKALDRIAELEAVLVRCNTLGVVPPLSPDHESNALADYRRTAQAEALRWAAGKMPGIVSLASSASATNNANVQQKRRLRSLADAIERGEVAVGNAEVSDRSERFAAPNGSAPKKGQV